MCQRNRNVKKIAYLAGCWLDLAQIWYRGYFWIPNPKSRTKIFIRRQNDVKEIPRYCLWKMHMMSLWRPIFLKTSLIKLLLKRDYYHTKFGWVCIYGSKVTEGDRGQIRSLQVENKLNRPSWGGFPLMHGWNHSQTTFTIEIWRQSHGCKYHLTDFFSENMVASSFCSDMKNAFKGELQRKNKLISHERALKMPENDMYITGICQAVLELSFKIGSGNHQRIIRISRFYEHFKKFREICFC